MVSSETFTGLASGADCLFLCEYLRDRRIRVRMGTTLSDEFYPEEGVLTGGVLAVHILDWRLMSCPLVLPRTSSELSLLMTWQSSHAFHCTLIPGSEAPHCEDWKHTSASGGVNKVPSTVVGLAPLIQEAHQCARGTVQGGSQPHPNGCSFEVGRRQSYTSDAAPSYCSLQAGLWLHCALLSIKHLWWESRRWVVDSVKWRHGLVCIMVSGGKIRQTDPECQTERTCREPLKPKWIPVDVLASLGNQLRVSDLCVFAVSAIGLPCTENIRCGYLCVRRSAATCACWLSQCQWETSDSRYRQTAEFYRHGRIPPHTDLRQLDSIHLKTRACIDNPTHHALHEFDRTTGDLYAPRPNGRGGMTRPQPLPSVSKLEAAMASAEINAELVCPLWTPNFRPRTWLRSQETQPHWRGEQMYDLQTRSPG